MKLNNVTITSPMAEEGTYRVETPPVRRNGQGAAIAPPYSRITWQWSILTPTQFGLWWTTILGGAASATFTSNNQLYTTAQVLTAVTHVTVLQPTYGSIESGNYRDVQVIMDQIVWGAAI
jgi:hypothetical protein